MSKVYQIVTDKIIKKLEQGTVPWRKPWVNACPVSWATQRPYRGINAFILEPGEYATWDQVIKAGGRIKPEEAKNYSIVVFWKLLEKLNKETNEKETVPLLRYFRVYEINTQCEGLESKRKEQAFCHDPIEEAEKIVQEFKERPEIRFVPGRAVYNQFDDIVKVPPLKDFISAEEYYCALFHELTHSTGHSKRLHRPGFEDPVIFGSESYSKEELIAEMGAAMLCGIAGIENITIDNSAAYIAGWLRKLQNDKKLVVQAAAQAQKAVDHILDVRALEEAC